MRMVNNLPQQPHNRRHNLPKPNTERNAVIIWLSGLGMLKPYVTALTGVTGKTIEGVLKRDRVAKGDPGGHGAGGVPDVVLAAGWIDKTERKAFDAMVKRAEKGESDERDGDE